MKHHFFAFYNKRLCKPKFVLICIDLSNKSFIEYNDKNKSNFYAYLRKYKIQNISIEKPKSLNYTKFYNILKKQLEVYKYGIVNVN